MTHARQPHLSRRGFCLCCLGAATFAQSRIAVDAMRAAVADEVYRRRSAYERRDEGGRWFAHAAAKTGTLTRAA